MQTSNASSPNGPVGASTTENAAGLGADAAETLEEKRGAAASGLHSAASSLHEKADSLPGGPRVSGAAHTAADALAKSADYMREHDLKDMVADVTSLVKRNPGPALLTAAVVGFLVARSFSRD